MPNDKVFYGEDEWCPPASDRPFVRSNRKHRGSKGRLCLFEAAIALGLAPVSVGTVLLSLTTMIQTRRHLSLL
eukprot:4751737-Lingulodinium_polyedra.AAC.1